MGACCGTDTIEEERQADRGAEERPLLPRRVAASLEDHNVINDALPRVYYVIIGRGPMAVVNHRTLIATAWGRARIDSHPILHIGAPNSWPSYVRHGLGQPNHLLSLPGFERQPSAAGPEWLVDGGLNSQYFGQCVDEEFRSLGRVEIAEEWVALIQSRAAPGQVDARIRGERNRGDQVHRVVSDCIAANWPPFEQGRAPYRLCLFDPRHRTARLVYANAIDICTGPGRPAVFPPADGDTDEIVAARTPPWLPPELWSGTPAWTLRRTLNGVDAIRDEVRFEAGQRICVTAGGGVGLNAAEKSRNHNCALDWFGREGLMPIFHNNPRNITYLKQRNNNDACRPGRRQDFGVVDEDDLIAHTRSHRMGRGAVLRTVANNNANGVDVTLQAQPGAGTLIRDFWGNHSALHQGGYWEFSDQYADAVAPMGVRPSLAYDRLVIPNGQETNQVGQPHAIAGHLGFRPVDMNGRMVALETEDGLVRVIGAACNDYPGVNQQTWIRAGRPAGGRPDYAMWTFHATLPVSAVIDGFIICGANTAIANRYFDEHHNRNVNTMTFAEIRDVVGDNDLAGRIIAQRNPNNGYKNVQELRDACGRFVDALQQFRFAY